MQDAKEMRKVYCDSLIEIAADNPDIVLVEADLMRCIQTEAFKNAYSDRFFNVGIAEANMIGVAAGLATCGKIPFCSSFATFATRRCFDQIFISAAYSRQNVKIVGTDPGIAAEVNGGTHMPFEDMGIMRTVPDMVCVEPTDAAQLAALMPQIVAHKGTLYLRLFRKKCETVFSEDTAFDLFRAAEISVGRDATIVASGIMVAKALQAAESLSQEGLSVGVLNTFTWKPIDAEAIIAAAKRSGALVTAENHNIFGGLYSAVTEVTAGHCPVPVECVGVRDRFGEVGKMPYLSEVFGLRAEDIADAVRRAVARKKS